MAGTNLAKAYVQIVPSTEGMKGMLQSAFEKEMPSIGESAGKSAGGGLLSGIAGILNGNGKSVIEGGLSSLLTEAGLSSAAAGPVAAIVTTVGAGLVKAGVKAAEVTAQVVKGTAEAGAAVAGLGVAGAVMLSKSAVESFATFEQVSDGARRIFDEVDYDTMAKDAFNAYKDLNLSANEYFSTIVDAGAGFAASMGDKKGYETARKGMIAVSDYAVATGKDINLLNQKFNLISRSASSYQTIADQFNGLLPQTSADFLAQAQAAGLLSSSYKKLTAVPVAEYQAALVAMMQKGTDTMNITGKTAEESLSTITGSLAMTKAAWQNMLVGLVDPDVDLKQQMSNLLESVLGAVDENGERTGGLLNNILPRFKEALTNIGPALKEALPEIASTVNGLLQDEDLYESLLDGAGAILDGIFENLPTLLDSALDRAPDLMTKFGEWIGKNLPELSESLLSTVAEHSEEISAAFTGMITQIFEGLKGGSESFAKFAEPIIKPFITDIVEALPGWISSAISSAKNFGGSIVKAIWDGIKEGVNNYIDSTNPTGRANATDAAPAIGTDAEPVTPSLGGKQPYGAGKLTEELPKTTEESEKATAALTETDNVTKTLSTDMNLTGGAMQIAAQNLGLTQGAAQGVNGQLSQTAAVTETVNGGMESLSGNTAAVNGALGETGAVTATVSDAMGGLGDSTTVAGGALGETGGAAAAAAPAVTEVGTASETAGTGMANAATGAESLTMTLGTVMDSAGQLTMGLQNIPTQFSVMWTACKAVFVNAGVFFSTVGTASATGFVTPWNAVPGKIQGVYDQIKSIFTSAAAEASGWGYDMAANFASGIQSGYGLVSSAVSSLTAMIKANLGFSEPEEGPLSDFHTYAPDMMALFAQGVADNEAMVRDQIRRSFDFDEYMNQTGTVTADGGGTDGREAELLQLILDVLNRIAAAKEGGWSSDELLDWIDSGLGRRAALAQR